MSSPFVADDLEVVTRVDEPVEVLLAGSGPDGVALVYAIREEPMHGQIEGIPPDLLYTPASGYFGEDHLWFVVGDGAEWSAEAHVRIHVLPPNRPPAAFDREVDAAAGRATAFRLLAEDPDGDELTFRIEDPPMHGEVTIEGDVASYRPDDGFLDEDAFTFVADDGELESAPAQVRIRVMRLENRPPEVESFSVDTDQEQSVTFSLRGIDPDGDPLTWQILSEPEHGQWARQGAEVTYAPDAGFHGEDRLVYRASDGLLVSAPGEVTLRVRRINRPPVVQNLVLTGDRGETLTGRVRATDPDGDALTFEIVREPAHGTASLVEDELTYTPDPEFVGMDSLVLRAFDGELYSPEATVTLILRRVNRPPTAEPVTVEVTPAQVHLIPLEGADPDGDRLTWEIVDPPAVGEVSVSGSWASLDLTEVPDFTGDIVFTVRAFDGELHSGPAEVRVHVRAPYIAPVARNMQVQTVVDTPVTFDLDVTGALGAVLSFAVATSPSDGEVDLDGREATYSPGPGFAGFDAFTFTVSDGETTSAPATVDVFVEARNRAPVAGDVMATVPQRDGGTFSLVGSDPDGDPIDFRVVEPPARGVVVIVDDQATYLPDGDFHGEDSFTYEAFDGFLVSPPALAVVTVMYVNRPPEAQDGEARADEGRSIDIVLEAFDPDDDDLTYRIVQAPAQGTATIEDAVVTYTPTPGFIGEDAFSWVADDGDLESSEAWVHVTVEARPPIARDDTYTMPREDLVLTVSAAEGVLANDDPGSAAAGDLVAVLPFVDLPFAVDLNRDGSFVLTLPAENAHLDLLEFPYRVGSPLGLADDGTVRIVRGP